MLFCQITCRCFVSCNAFTKATCDSDIPSFRAEALIAFT